MTGFKAVPADAGSTKSYQFFRDVCQQALDERAKELGKAPVKFDPAKLKSFNRETGDGEFGLVYEDKDLDFGVNGLVLWRSHEILIRGGKLSAKDPKKESKALAGRFLEDAATFTEKVVGKEELEGAKLEDGVGDPRLKGKENTEAFQFLNKECPNRFEQFLRSRYGESGGSKLFDPRFVRIENPVPGDGEYSLRFESRANNFFCESAINSSTHLIAIRSGSTALDEKVTPELPQRFHHSCSETKALVGESELLNPEGCKDYTEAEQRNSHIASLGWNLFLTTTLGIGVYRSYTKPTGWINRLVTRFPFLRNLSTGLLAYWGYDSIAANFVDSQNPWRKYGSPVAGVLGTAAPSLARTAIAQRLATSAAGQRIATSLLGRAAGGIVSKAGGRLLLVWGMNKLFQWGVGSDYEASVNKRVTDMIYDKHVYELDGWDFLVLPLAVKGVRASARFLAPDAMNWAVMRDNKDLREDIYKQDEKDSQDGDDMLREVLPPFLYSSNPADREEILKLLRSPVELSADENFLSLALKAKGIEGIKALRPNMSEAEIETFLRKYLAHQTQEVAKGLVFVERSVNNWAREAFNADGTLKEGETAATKLTDHWPPPAAPFPVAKE